MKKLLLLSTLATFGSLAVASAATGFDDYQSYSSLSYGDNGGTGLGAHTYLEGTSGGIYLATGGPSISGNKSMGIYASTGGQALFRTTTVGSFGIYDVSVRFNLNNEVAFSGLNLKYQQGTIGGAGAFGTGELISFGLTPGTGNNSIFVGGLSNTDINLGSDIRGAVINFRLTFDATSGTYTLGAKFNSNPTYTNVSGSLKSTGNAPTFLGFGNFNTGSGQDLIVDDISIIPEPSSAALLGLGLGALALYRRRRQG